MELSTELQIINVRDRGRQGLLASFDSEGVDTDLSGFRGDGSERLLRFVAPSGLPGRPWTDFDVETARAVGGVRVAIGALDQVPASGTWPLAYDGEDLGLTALASDISGAALLAALNANSQIVVVGGISAVTKTGSSYRVVFATPGPKDLFTSGTNTLQPSSYVRCSCVTEGRDSPPTQEVWTIHLRQNPYCFQDQWTAVAVTPVEATQPIDGGAGSNSVQVITLAEGVYGGSYAATIIAPNFGTGDGATPVSKSFTLTSSMSADEIKALFLTHPEAVKVVDDAEVAAITVAGEIGGPFTVEFTAHLGNVVIPDIVATDINLLVPKIIKGAVDFDRDGLYQAFIDAESDTLDLLYEVELQFPGKKPTTVLQVPYQVHKDLIDFEALLPAPKALYPLPTEILATTAQVLTAAQKAQVRTNLSLVPAGGKVIYVSKATTATDTRTSLSAYDPAVPFATPAAAIAAASAGDEVRLGPGSWELAASQAIAGITLRGCGPATVIGVAGTVDVFRINGDHTHFADFLVDGYSPFAFNTSNAAITWTNLTMRGVSTRNGIDVLILGASGQIHLDCFSCDFRSSYDLIVDNAGSHAGTRIRCFDCVLDSDSAGGISTTLGTIEIIGGSLRGFAHAVSGGVLRINGAVMETMEGGNWCTVTDGELTVANCLTVGSTNIAGLNMSGGMVRLTARLDTSANAASNPITKSGGTLILGAGTALVAEAGRVSIHAATAQSVTNLGYVSNTAKHANVTLQVNAEVVSGYVE